MEEKQLSRLVINVTNTEHDNYREVAKRRKISKTAWMREVLNQAAAWELSKERPEN